MQKICVDLFDPSDKEMLLSDVDGDGTVSILDDTTVQRFCAGIIDTFPATSSLANK